MKEKRLSFRVSSGLKNIIGRDLISDKFIAIFELVKNAYDAGASEAKLSFLLDENGNGCIEIEDNGCGMNYDDLINKWLFVAYSEKKDERKRKSYRDELKREYAGAKGVGRFSCDCLGTTLELITRRELEKVKHIIKVNWANFDKDDNEEFVNIPIEYREEDNEEDWNGTIIRITNLREPWHRDDLLKLRKSLMKLISPDLDNEEFPFVINLKVPSEIENDNKIIKKNEDNDSFNRDREVVNGAIHNDIVSILNLKTTNISVKIPADGTVIETRIEDRGQEIFSVIEKNRRFGLLHGIEVSVIYLNRSAKLSFSRQMGVGARAYGSVFIYKNGFRINPYGEPGQDFFGIDSRKQQGYARYLGTREILGQISIQGTNEEFIETSSRAHGFVKTSSVEELQLFFVEKVLKVLERYVTRMINWGQPLKENLNDEVKLVDIASEIIKQFSSLTESADVLSVHYNPEIFTKTVDNSISSQLSELESIVGQSENPELVQIAEKIKSKTEQVLNYAGDLEKENVEKEKELKIANQEKEIREKQVYFLENSANQDVKNLLNGYHTTYTATQTAKKQMDKILRMLETGQIDSYILLDRIAKVYKMVDRIGKMSDLALKGNLALCQTGKNDIVQYINQYLEKDLLIKDISIKVDNQSKDTLCKFDVVYVGIILDNIISNSKKAGATELRIVVNEAIDNIWIAFIDNGRGLSDSVNPDLLFEWGTSDNLSKRGFGIGLYHVKSMAKDMRGDVTIDKSYKDGFKIVLKLKR